MTTKTHTDDPLRRAKIQLEGFLGAANIDSPALASKIFGVSKESVEELFIPADSLEKSSIDTLFRILYDLGLEIVIVPSEMLEALPTGVENTMHLRGKAKERKQEANDRAKEDHHGLYS